MPPPKKAAAGRNAGTEAGSVAENPYATPDPGPENLEVFVRDETTPRVPVTKFVMPSAAPMPEFRANGHVLTDRGWVREEGHHG